jgi:hypothetical protein
MTKATVWQTLPKSERGDWQYYEHWVAALETVIADHRLIADPPWLNRDGHG